MTVPEYRAWLSAEYARKVAEADAALAEEGAPPAEESTTEPATPAEEAA